MPQPRTLMYMEMEVLNMPSIDLNSDLGESFGRYTLGLDDQVIPLVSSVNVACGMHAGDPAVMRRTVKLAADAGVAVGAHPGYPDLQGFGRRDIAMSPDEAYDYILYQIGALQAFCHATGARMHHVKPHGQLYNRAAVDPELARAVAAAVHDANLDLVLVGLANSELIRAGQAEGIRTAQEFFADRNYTDEDFAVARVVRAVKEGTIESASGKLITVKPDTICIHGDNVHALEFAGKIRTALTEAGVEVKPV